jgi:hypothetical protein
MGGARRPGRASRTGRARSPVATRLARQVLDVARCASCSHARYSREDPFTPSVAVQARHPVAEHAAQHATGSSLLPDERGHRVPDSQNGGPAPVDPVRGITSVS